MRINTNQCKWDKDTKVFSITLDSLPNKIEIESAVTGAALSLDRSEMNEKETFAVYKNTAFSLHVTKKERCSQVVLLIYDIPQDSEVNNPSHRLRKVGFRANLSCWIVPLAFIPEDLIAQFKEFNINYKIIKFDESEEERIREMAKVALEEETARIQGSLIKQIDDADLMLKKVMEGVDLTHNEMEGAKKRRYSRIYQALRESDQAIKDAVECCQRFDITMDLNDLLAGTQRLVEAHQVKFKTDNKKK